MVTVSDDVVGGFEKFHTASVLSIRFSNCMFTSLAPVQGIIHNKYTGDGNYGGLLGSTKWGERETVLLRAIQSQGLVIQ